MSRPDPWLLCDPYCAQFKTYHDEMNENEEPPVTEAELDRVAELDAKLSRLGNVPDKYDEVARELADIAPRLAAELAAARAAIKVAREAFSKLMRKLSAIEVLGEWEALDINSGSRKKTRLEVDAVVAEASAALTQLNTHTHE